MFPEELFEAGYKLMAERWEIQQREEALDQSRKRGWSDGFLIGFWCGTGFGLVLWLLFR